jgi:hypothetical protein
MVMLRMCSTGRLNGQSNRVSRPPRSTILTPYPGTALHKRLDAQRRITTQDWDLYDTRHVVFRPARMSAEELERGYWRAYRDFYRWGSIARGAASHADLVSGARHFAMRPAGRNSSRSGTWLSAQSELA